MLKNTQAKILFSFLVTPIYHVGLKLLGSNWPKSLSKVMRNIVFIRRISPYYPCGFSDIIVVHLAPVGLIQPMVFKK